MLATISMLLLLQSAALQDISAITDLQTLSELPLEKLLKLKHNFDDAELPLIVEDDISATLEVQKGGPEALALQAKRKPYKRGGYEPEYHHKKGEDKKDVSSIFQTSVTTLAFVAFGGYLLCLIVQAIRAKNMGNGDMMAMLVRKPIRKRVPQRQTKPGRRPRPGNNSRYKREAWLDADPEGMYEALITLAEGYSKYEAVDYKHFNRSIKAFV